MNLTNVTRALESIEVGSVRVVNDYLAWHVSAGRFIVGRDELDVRGGKSYPTDDAAAIIVGVPTPSPITPASLAVFLALAKDAPNWGGTPYVGGNVGLSKAECGNLTQLKIAGLLTTHEDPKSQGGGGPYVVFTDAGRALAKSHGLSLGDGR